MLSVEEGCALLAVATLRVMRAGARMGSGPSTTWLTGAVLFVDGPTVLTEACVPIASQVSERAAMGLAVRPVVEDGAVV